MEEKHVAAAKEYAYKFKGFFKDGKVLILPTSMTGFIMTYCAQKEKEKLNENAAARYTESKSLNPEVFFQPSCLPDDAMQKQPNAIALFVSGAPVQL